MPDSPDVVTADSSPATDTTTVDTTAQVTGDGTQDAKPDRPVENLAAEFNRKFGKLQSQLDTAIQYMAATQQAKVQPITQTASQPSDEDLWVLAQQGDRGAFDQYMQRKARAETQAVLSTKQRTDIVTGQLQALTQKYPSLNDGTHPLTQKVQQAYQLMTQNGYATGPATLLEAAKTAIADSPDIVSDLYTRSAHTREQGRPSATTRAQAGVMGASSRADSPSRQNGKTLSREQVELAKRMNVKDPAGSFARFKKRRDEGVSNIGAVGNMLNEEDL